MTIERAAFGSGTKLTSRERAVLRDAIEGTDWEETPVLDVVKYESVARSEEPQRPEYEVERHPDVVDYSRYEDPMRRHTVYRITEDSCAEMGVDPETGEPLDVDPAGESPGVEVSDREFDVDQEPAMTGRDDDGEDADDDGEAEADADDAGAAGE